MARLEDARAERSMDQRIECFLTDDRCSRARGRRPGGVGEGVRASDCDAIFRAREDNKRMKDQAARVCRVLCHTVGFFTFS